MRGLASIIVALSLATPAAAQSVKITSADCARLVTKHVPAPDVAYTSGVDVRGRAVAPADLGGAPQIRIPDQINIPITVDLQKRLGIPANPNLFKPEAQLGVVSFKDGKVFYGGQPIGDSAQVAIAAECQKIMGRPR